MSATDARATLELNIRRYFPTIGDRRLGRIMDLADQYASALAAADVERASAMWDVTAGRARLAEATAEYFSAGRRS